MYDFFKYNLVLLFVSMYRGSIYILDVILTAIIPPWRFQGDGVLSFNPLLRPIQLPWLNALSVRTMQKDAFLMSIQIGQNSSAVLSVSKSLTV
jgi:hypothetical protein